MSVFTPDLYLNKVTDITPQFLAEHNIHGLVLDVDNTLTLHNSQEVPSSVLKWLDLMQAHGIQMTIVSNNSEERVAPFAKRLELKHVSFGCKPLTHGFSKAVMQFGLPVSQIAVVGDQIYTDIVGGNLKGMFTILTVPFQEENNTFFRFKRKMEQLHIKRYHRRKGGK